MPIVAVILIACSSDPSLRSAPPLSAERVVHDHYRLWYRDSDADGHGDPAVTSRALTRPVGYVANATDCNDHNASISPTAPEVCADSVDNDCDGDRDEDCGMGVEDADATVGIDDETARLGERMASGDFDADGIADLAIGAKGQFSTLGAVYLLYGPASGSVAAHDLVSISESTGTLSTYFGAWVGAGDANGDGPDDLLVSADYLDEYYLFLGPVTADRSPADADAELVLPTTISGPKSVDIVGDHDGDGTSEVVMGYHGGDVGTVYIVPGTTSGVVDLSTEATYAYSGAPGSSLGVAVDLGDVNGDGLTDLAMGAGTAGYIVEGGAPAGDYDVADIASATLTDPVRGSYFAPFSIEGGDYDGDGTGDLLVGAILAESPTSAPLGGIVYGFLGPLSGAFTVRDAAVRWESPRLVLNLGWAVVADDLDGDGGLDVAMSSPGAHSVYVQHGYASGVVDVGTLPYVSVAASEFGTSIATIPDWMGDGGAELALAAPGMDGDTAEDAGIVYIFSDAF